MERIRMCVACREGKEKNELVRIVKMKDGQIFIDPTGKMNGRGAYVCRDKKCFEKVKKQHALNRAFKINIPEEIIIRLQEEIFGQNKD